MSNHNQHKHESGRIDCELEQEEDHGILRQEEKYPGEPQYEDYPAKRDSVTILLIEDTSQTKQADERNQPVQKGDPN